MNVEQRVRTALAVDAEQLEVPPRPPVDRLAARRAPSPWRLAVAGAMVVLAVLVVVDLARPASLSIGPVGPDGPASPEVSLDPADGDVFATGTSDDGLEWTGAVRPGDGFDCLGIELETPAGLAGTGTSCQRRTDTALQLTWVTTQDRDGRAVAVAGWVTDEVDRVVWELPDGPVELELHTSDRFPRRLFAGAGRTDETSMVWAYDADGRRVAGVGISPRRDSDAGEVLAVPDDVEIHPTFLADGTPVFVVLDGDDVAVLSAISPHQTPGARKAVVWCPSTERFVDPWHGSRFDRTGRWLTGPAPTDLDRYDAELDPTSEGTEVTVGQHHPGGDRPGTARTDPDSPGPACDIDPDGRIADPIIAHQPPAQPPAAPSDTVGDIIYAPMP